MREVPRLVSRSAEWLMFKDAVIEVKNSLKLPPAPASPIAPAPPKDQPPNI